MLPFRHQTRICNAKCCAVGIVKGVLPEEVLFVDSFFLILSEGEKRLKSVSPLLNHLRGTYHLLV